MNLKSRISRLENFIGVGDEIPPLVVIDIMNCQKGSQDKGTPKFGIVPGKIGGFHGTTLTRAESEPPADFLERCEAKHLEFYNT